MKRLFLAMAALVLCACATVRADDVAEAQKQFDLFRQYSKTDDEKLLDLFAPDISVTITINSDKGPVHDTVLPASTFQDLVRQNLDKKAGNNGTYKEVEFKQEGDTVRMTCTRVDEKTGFTGPFLVIFGKDAAGQLKMKAMKFSAPPLKVTPGEGTNSPAPPPTTAPTPADIPVPKATP